jgi:hypothetical protein
MLVMLALTAAVSHARTAAATNCRKMVLEGEVSTGKEWKSAIGQGWVFRVLPIAQEKADYSGWDLVVDRAQGAGFPDALLLATLPYNSINEREVGTTFGLRAQDAIGWNPRSFRFLSTPAALSEGQQIFRSLSADGSFGRTKSGDPPRCARVGAIAGIAKAGGGRGVSYSGRQAGTGRVRSGSLWT